MITSSFSKFNYDTIQVDTIIASVPASKKRHVPTCLPPCKTHSLLVAPCTLWIVKFENSSLIQEWRFVILFLLKPEVIFVVKQLFYQQQFCLLCDGFVL